MKANMHTHSTYCDGNDRPEEMIRTAIEKGFDILGFSGHGHSPYDNCSMSLEATDAYLCELSVLQEKYQDQIMIYKGIEEDSTCRIPAKDPYDFVISSVHFLEHNGSYLPVDYSRAAFDEMLETWYDGDFLKLAQAYYARMAEQKDFAEADIIGHFDLLTKYNEDESYVRFDDSAYMDLAVSCLETLGNGFIYEVNTGAIARGYRKTPYPAFPILACMKERGIRIMLNSDCHDRTKLDCGYELALELIQKAGFRELYILKNGQFQPVELSQFL